MRDISDQYFSPSQIMLLGHMHINIAIDEIDSYSIKQFSPDFHIHQYSIIQDDGEKYREAFRNLQ